MRQLGSWLGGIAGVLVALGTTSTASATPMPRLRHEHGALVTDRASHALPFSLGSGAWSADPIVTTDVLSRHNALTFDPATGATDATFEVTLRAEQSGVDRIYLYIDAGLGVTSATDGAAALEVHETAYQQIRLVQIDLPAPLTAGDEATISIGYGGTLACPEVQGGAYCDLALPMGVLMEGSALPMLIDASNLGGYNIWGSSRSLELTLPSGTAAVAPGELTGDMDDGVERTLRWEMAGYHSVGAYLVILGDLASGALAGTTPATSIVRAADAPSWELEMKDWMGDILAFVDAQAGAPLPFADLSIIKLAANEPLPGTAAHGMVLLADSYGSWGGEYFEETLAHETSHEWWGVLVAPTDFNKSRWLVEGLATLSQIDYAAEHFANGLDRDSFLARRYREHGILLRYLAQLDLPAVVPPIYPQLDSAGDTLWAYIRSSAALEYLRVQTGDEGFAKGLRRFRADCANQLCDTADFRAILEAESGVDLGAAFAAAVTSQGFPAPALAWSQAGATAPVELVASGAGLDLPLVVDVELESGEHLTRSVLLHDGEPAAIEVGAAVRSVRPNPRQDAVIWTRSAAEGDLDFDMEVDGADVIHCAFLQGRDAATAKPDGEGLNRLDLDFDPRCDGDRDGVIADADMMTILAAFGTLREAP
jgi:hypothetical protein